MDSSAIFITLPNNKEVDIRKNMGLLRHVLKHVNFHFTVEMLPLFHCPSIINANTRDMDLRCILFNVPLTAATLFNKVLRSLYFHSTNLFFNPLLCGFSPRYVKKFVFRGVFKLICVVYNSLNLKSLSAFHGGFKYVGFYPWISHPFKNNNQSFNCLLYSFPVSFVNQFFCLQCLLGPGRHFHLVAGYTVVSPTVLSMILFTCECFLTL